jgi:mRNA interferase RelE/StbE
LRIAALAHDPRPSGVEKLHGVEGRYRVRQGDYRIIYVIDDALRRVIVLKVRHRREAYLR